MQFTSLTLSIILASSTALATPVEFGSSAANIFERDTIGVGYGQQIQTSDETNHWVVWIEGKSACPATQTLGKLVDSPCGQLFTLGGSNYKLGDCNGNHEPQQLQNAAGKQVHSCTLDHDKINCHNGLHDIVKHGKCT